MPKVDSPRPVRLRQIQRLFGTAIFRPLTDGYQMDPVWSDGRPTADIADTLIKANDRLTSFERLEIYNRQYWFRIIDCFHDDFPGVRAILGTKRFQHLARTYLAQCPSRSFTLRDLGQFLPAFLENNPQLAGTHIAPSLDMVRLEWAHVVAFDGPSRPPVTPLEIQSTPPESLHLALQPHMSLLTVHYAVDDYLLEVRKLVRKSKGEIPVVRKRPRKLPAPVPLLVHRHDNAVYYKRLEAGEFHILSSLIQGLPLADAIAHAFEKSQDRPPEAADLTRWFENWTRLGWLCPAA